MWLLLLACGAFSFCLSDAATLHKPLTPRTEELRQERVKGIHEKRDQHDGFRKYNPLLYEGFFGRSLWWLTEKGFPEPICLATFIAEKIAIVPCECVTHAADPFDFVTYINHEPWKKYTDQKQEPLIGGPVTVLDVDDYRLTEYFPRNSKSAEYPIQKITPHDQCGSLYTFNIAILQIADQIPDVKIAWVLTREDILYTMAFRRVLAGQAISGKCMAPYYSLKDGPFDQLTPEKLITVDVEFENWDGCSKTICPQWNRHLDFESDAKLRREAELPYYAPEVCLNRVQFTKFCVRIIKPFNDSCVLKPGTPVYCEAGDLNGLFGFIVSATFECFKTHEPDDLIFQGLHISMNWLKNQIKLREIADKTFELPRWMDDIRQKEISAEYEKQKDVKPTPEPIPRTEDQLANVFADDAAESIVNVYYDGGKICEATQISPSSFILPCYCLTYQYRVLNKKKQWIIEEHKNIYEKPYNNFAAPKRVGPNVYLPGVSENMDWSKLRVRRALDDNNIWYCKEVCQPDPYQNPSQYDEVKERISPWQPEQKFTVKRPYCYCVNWANISDTCNSHYMDDYATITTVQPVKDAKTAWIHTSDPKYFKRALNVLAASNMLAGDCFVVPFIYNLIPGRKPDSLLPLSRIETQYVRVNLAHWDLCRPIVCPPVWLFGPEKQDPCWNAHMVQNPDNINNIWMEPPAAISRMCITSYNYKFMCNLVENGSPVFCKSDHLRGLIGFVSKFHMPACDRENNREAYDRIKKKSVNAIVMMRLDRFFTMNDLAARALIRRMERSSVGRETWSLVLATFLFLCFTLLSF